MHPENRNENRTIAVATLALLSVLGLLLTFARPGHATQPECTADRHYDGVACCPAPETTTTTLPSAECGECPSCPLPGPCPTVTCQDGDTVVVDRCPDVVFPMLQPCRERPKLKNGACKIGHVAFGGRCWKCPRPKAPLRGLIPRTTGTY